jgi:hypothetical protein
VTAPRLHAPCGEGARVAGGGGGGGGAPAAPGDASGLHTVFSAATCTTAGGDFDPVPTFAMDTPLLGLAISPVSAATTAVVQDWLTNPAQNFGWLLKIDEAQPAGTVRRFDSRESTTGFGPFLLVKYLAPGQAGAWGTGCPVGGGTFDLRIIGAPIGGSTIQLVHLNGPANSVAASFFSLDLNPIGVPLLPGCTLYLTSVIPGFVAGLDGAGNGSAPWSLPTTWPGLYVVAQAAALDSNPLGFVLSDAGLMVIQ